MGKRLTQIATRTGDDGTTGLSDGSRVPKDSLRIVAIGDVDELNSQIGVLLAETLPDPIRDCLTDVQHRLFDLGGELSVPGHTCIAETHVTALEDFLDHLNASLPSLKEFILPGGSRAAALCHVARAVARRAERSMVALSREAEVSPASLKYINRLSDLLFVMCRTLNRHAHRDDVFWQPSKKT